MDATSFDGTRLHFEIDGPEHAEALLLSNSLGTDLSLWEPQIAALSERFRVIRYDSRGHGKSAAPEGEYSIDMLGRDALAVLDAAGVKQGPLPRPVYGRHGGTMAGHERAGGRRSPGAREHLGAHSAGRMARTY